mgnify:FL=1
MKLSDRWINIFMGVAFSIAKASKDGSLKVGSVLVRPDKTIASIGFNGFPKRIEDDENILNDDSMKHIKYSRIVHAECNCLNYNRDIDLNKFHLFVTAHPCDKCALRIASTDISYIYYAINDDFENRWKSEIKIAKDIFLDAGIEIYGWDINPTHL